MENEETTVEKVDVEIVTEEVLNEENLEEELSANDEGTLEEVYRDKRTGNIVMNPKIRSLNKDNNRRELCWNLYLKSVRDGNPSAVSAAKAAGFSPNTALNIGGMKWFKDKKDNLRRSKMMNNAEKNIARILNMGYTELKKLEDGSTQEVVDKDVLRIVADMSKTIVTTLGKELYSNKTEVKVTAVPLPILNVLELENVSSELLTGTNESVDEPAS